MKLVPLLIFLLVPALLVITLGGFYPVAAVDGSPILSGTWKKAQVAAKKFVMSQNKAGPEDYTPVLADIKRNTLTFLIEDAILRKEGEKLIRGFDRLSRARMLEAIQGGGGLASAAKLIYGLTLPEFQDLVLLPQARRDTAREILAERQVDFEKWFAEAKKSKKVKLYFVPFIWDGEAVR